MYYFCITYWTYIYTFQAFQVHRLIHRPKFVYKSQLQCTSLAVATLSPACNRLADTKHCGVGQFMLECTSPQCLCVSCVQVFQVHRLIHRPKFVYKSQLQCTSLAVATLSPACNRLADTKHGGEGQFMLECTSLLCLCVSHTLVTQVTQVSTGLNTYPNLYTSHSLNAQALLLPHCSSLAPAL